MPAVEAELKAVEVLLVVVVKVVDHPVEVPELQA
jgi:hypothetical protein